MTCLADPTSVRCRHCRASKGYPCRTGSFGSLPPSRSHAVRKRDALAVAAHSDPVLDRWFIDSGPCLLCCVEGLGARHRRVDGIAGMLAAGEDPEVVAGEFGCGAEAVEAVIGWMRRWPGAWL